MLPDDVQAMARIRDNLAQLFYADGHARLRALVVDRTSPRFGDMLGFVPDAAKALIGSLNANQQEAVRRVLLADQPLDDDDRRQSPIAALRESAPSLA